MHSRAECLKCERSGRSASPSGHFPHFWTEGGPICSKLCYGTGSGPTVDVVRRDAQ